MRNSPTNRTHVGVTVVFFDGESYWLSDGFHRVAAAVQAEKKTIETRVIEGTRRDAVLYSVGANAAHGLRRTNADKRNAVKTLLYDAEWSKWSDREIARRCGVDNSTVTRMSRETEENSILLQNNSMERSFIHHKTGEVSIMKTERIGSGGIVPEARMLLRETDAIEDRREMRLLRTMEPEKQVKVALLIASGEAHTLRDATRRITSESIHEMTLAECVAGKL